MKQTLFSVFLFVSASLMAQVSPPERHNACYFPVGCKFTIKLIPTDSAYYDVEVIDFKAYNVQLETLKNDTVLSKTGVDNTISFCFCYATNGKTEKEQKDNRHITLIARNYTKVRFDYTTDIQREKNGSYSKTSNVGLIPGITVTEMWPYFINRIGLSKFTLHKE
jgi:hypothetical protein